MKVEIYEIFKTIQGEGRLQGVPSVILRLAECNLNCKWCDTKHFFQANKGYEISFEELLKQLSDLACNSVVITGGEPYFNNKIEQLVDFLKENGFHITIETNSTIKKSVICDLVSMSPKLSNSIPTDLNEEETKKYNDVRLNIEAIDHYIQNYNYQIKFVVSDKSDLEEVKDILSKLKEYDPVNVFIMPLATTRAELYECQKGIVKMCIDNNLRYANRLQLQIWDDSEEIV